MSGLPLQGNINKIQDGISNNMLSINQDGSINCSINGSLANQKTATIAINTSLSGVVDLEKKTLTGISMPSTWTPANITFDVSNDNVNYGPLYYQGIEYILSEAGSGRQVTIDPIALLPWRYLKIRSGTEKVPINQIVETVVTLWIKPV